MIWYTKHFVIYNDTAKQFVRAFLNFMKYLMNSFQIIIIIKKKSKHLPNLTDKSSKNNQAFYFIFQKIFNLLAPELFFLILAHPVYKMWIIHEPNMLELWHKLHFEEKKMESIYHV